MRHPEPVALGFSRTVLVTEGAVRVGPPKARALASRCADAQLPQANPAEAFAAVPTQIRREPPIRERDGQFIQRR